MTYKFLAISAFLLFTIGLAAFAIWRNVRVLNTLAELLRNASYSWDGWNSLRKLSGIWEDERVAFSKRYANPAIFSVTLYRNTGLPNIEVRFNRKGQLVVNQVQDVLLLFRKVNYSLTEEALKATTSQPERSSSDIKKYFNSKRLELSHQLLSSCNFDVITINADSIGACSENYKHWNSITRKDAVEKSLTILQQIAKSEGH